MKTAYYALIAVLALAVSAVCAEETAAPATKPSFSISQTDVVTAKVLAVNPETRDVTLELADGTKASFTVSEEARNLDQVMIGDTVVAKYMERLDVQVVASDGTEPAAMGVTTVGRSAKGDMPGFGAVDTEMETAIVEEINIEANTFKLRHVGDVVEQYSAMNPENLKRAEVGDMVIIKRTQAVAVSVEPQE